MTFLGKQEDGLISTKNIHRAPFGVGVSFRLTNMIPFHGIRSSFGTRLAFFFRFLATFLACGHQKSVPRPSGWKKCFVLNGGTR